MIASLDARRLHPWADARANGMLRAVIFALCFLMGPPSGHGSEPVTIRLRAAISHGENPITLHSIADIHGGSDEARRRIGELDIASLGPRETHARISRTQVELRLRLSGIPDSGWRLTGAEFVEIAPRSTVDIEQSILDSIRQGAADQWRIAPEELHVKFASPLPVTLTREPPATSSRWEPLLPAEPKWGRRQISLGEYVGASLRRTHVVTVELRRLVEVAVAAAVIEPGDELTSERVQFETRLVDHAEHLATPSQIRSAVATRRMQPGDLIARNHVRDARAAENSIVRSRSPVRVVARKGGLCVTLSNAETLQSARIGESVRVRNPSSGQILVGVLVSPEEIHVRF